MYFRNEGNPQTKLVNKLLHSLGKRMGGLSRLESIIKDQLKANNIVFDLNKKNRTSVLRMVSFIN